MKPGHLTLLGDANSVHLQRWAREMMQRGWRVSVVTARPAEIAGVERQVTLPPVARPVDWLWRAGAARRALDALAPDIVHAHYVTSYGYLGARAGRHPLVMTAWGSDLLLTPRESALKRRLTGWTLRRADLVTGDSTDLVEAAAAYGLSAPPLLIHWGVDLARFAATDWASKPRFDVVSLRNWEPNYRIGAIVEAHALLRKLVPQAHLHLLGGGPGRDELAARITALGLQDAVTLHGRLDDAGMAAVLARCKVSVSVPISDATSVSVLESMACGLAVVASDLPANRQWLGDDTELLPAAADDAALARETARALEALAADDARAAAIGARHRDRMQREGSRAIQMDRMHGQYLRLLGRGR